MANVIIGNEVETREPVMIEIIEPESDECLLIKAKFLKIENEKRKNKEWKVYENFGTNTDRKAWMDGGSYADILNQIRRSCGM